MNDIARKALFNMISNSNKPQESVDVAQEFLDAYVFTVEKIDTDNVRKPSKSISPSSIKCSRASTFKLLGAEQTDVNHKQQLIEINQNGSERHEAIQQTVVTMPQYTTKFKPINIGDYIRKNKIDIKIVKEADFDKGIFETKLYSEKYHISFLADGMVEYNGKYYILEIKTQSSDVHFKQSDVHDKHIDQATAYCTLLKADGILYFYEERNYLGKKCYLYTPTAKQKAEMISKIEDINWYADNNMIPAKPKQADEDMKFCQYCGYATLCTNIGIGQVKYEQKDEQ